VNILLVLAGTAPSVKLLHSEMKIADLSIAVDGGYNTFQKYDVKPDLLIGDLDSTNTVPTDIIKTIHIADQNQTDLQKSLLYIREHYKAAQITLLGALGARSDHLINNLKICSGIPSDIKVIIKHDKPAIEGTRLETIFRITPQVTSGFNIQEGLTLSLFAVSEFDELNSKGLKWDIKAVNSKSPLISQSNQALVDDPQFSLESGIVYLAVYQ
jgi:thiamine pyrophosphokinase